MRKAVKSFSKDQRGFSLVELIIVMAIIIALTGSLALIFVKYVGRSKRTVDVTSGCDIAAAIERNINLHPDLTIPANYSFNSTTVTMPTEATATTLMDFMLTDFDSVPVSRWNETYYWTVKMDVTGKKVDKVYLATTSGGNDYELYPDGSIFIKGDSL